MTFGVLMHACGRMKVSTDNNKLDDGWRDDALPRIGRRGKDVMFNGRWFYLEIRYLIPGLTTTTAGHALVTRLPAGGCP